ncbi:hypothetical protein A0H76_1810 [Hepatospora eriocheir]|uniref:SP-RING-type domain-containing protein n=1 Tax=Hepatospora eriocheir TaxID=1081669 RepID=A0A1X0QGR8_9MICR|nr:hypothetical protein A0H76_1810 [Hepatospora eriocheir]
MFEDLNGILKSRKERLEDLINKLRKDKIEIDKELATNCLIHIELANNPTKLTNPESISVDVDVIINDFDCEASIIDDNTNQMCYLTQAPIKIKFISNCGHTFEESAIKDYMKHGNKNCPVIGCNRILKKKE